MEQKETQQLITVQDLCVSLNIEDALIGAFQETGLIDIVEIENVQYIHVSQLPQLERLIRLHDDLDINVEGIGAILHLMDRINSMQAEIMALKNKLRLYEVIDL